MPAATSLSVRAVQNLADADAEEATRECERQRHAAAQRRHEEEATLRKHILAALAAAYNHPAEERRLGRTATAESLKRWARLFVAAGKLVQESDATFSFGLHGRLKNIIDRASPLPMKHGCTLLVMAIEEPKSLTKVLGDTVRRHQVLRQIPKWMQYVFDELWPEWDETTETYRTIGAPDWASQEECRHAAEAIRPSMPQRVRGVPVSSVSVEGSTPYATSIVYIGNTSYRVGDQNPISVTDSEHAVLQEFLKGESLSSRQLIDNSGNDRATRILAALTTKYDGAFFAAIDLPGKRGNGGYFVRIVKGTERPNRA